MTGFYTFKWDRPASEVYVTGTFDGWSRSTKLDKAGGVFVKKVELPVENILYKFVVDGKWVTDPNAPFETEESGVQNNILLSTVIAETEEEKAMEAAMINSAAPESTTAALAADVPKESEAVAISSVAPESTTASLAGGVPLEQVTPGAGDVPGGFLGTPASEMVDPTPIVPKEHEQVFSVNPLPASESAENPITLQPGEAVPRVGTESIHSHVKLDKESYETTGQAAEQAKVIAGQASEQAKAAAATAIPVVSAAVSNIATATGLTAGPVEQPATPVPEIVKQSIAEAGAPAEAAAFEDLGEAKKEIETELKHWEVVQALPTTEGPKEAVALAVAEPTLAPAAQESAAKISEQKTPVVTNGINTKTIMAHEITLNKPADVVPEPVKHSVAEAGVSAEAASEPKAIARKEAVEEQLKENVRPSAPIPQTNGACGAKTSIETPRKSTEAISSSSKKSKRRSFFGMILSKLHWRS